MLAAAVHGTITGNITLATESNTSEEQGRLHLGAWRSEA